jgi:hypothetical protein
MKFIDAPTYIGNIKTQLRLEKEDLNNKPLFNSNVFLVASKNSLDVS